MQQNYTIPEFSRIQNWSRSTTYKLVGAGYLKVVKVGRRVLVPESERQRIQAVLEERGALPI